MRESCVVVRIIGIENQDMIKKRGVDDKSVMKNREEERRIEMIARRKIGDDRDDSAKEDRR